MSNPTTTSGDVDVFAILSAANDLLTQVDFSRLLTDEIMTANTAVSTLAGRARLVQTKLASRVQELSDEKRVAPPEDILGRENGMGNDAAARISRHAKLLADFPAFSAALSDGAISDGHLDALATHLRLLTTADQLICVASGESLSRVSHEVGRSRSSAGIWLRCVVKPTTATRCRSRHGSNDATPCRVASGTT